MKSLCQRLQRNSSMLLTKLASLREQFYLNEVLHGGEAKVTILTYIIGRNDIGAQLAFDSINSYSEKPGRYC